MHHKLLWTMSTEYQDVCFPCQPLLSSSIRYPNECRMFQHPKSCLSMFLILSLRWFAKCLSVCSFMGLAMALPLVFLVRRAWLDTLTKQGMNSHNKNSTYWLEANDLSIQIMGRLSTWKHDLWKKIRLGWQSLGALPTFRMRYVEAGKGW